MEPKPVRLAIISHILYDSGHEMTGGRDSLELLESAFWQIRAGEPDLLLDLGNRIACGNREIDRRRAEAVVESFEQSKLPRVHLLGAHDLANLPLTVHKHLLGTHLPQKSMRIRGLELIFWYPLGPSHVERPTVTARDINRLKRRLKHARYPAVLFTNLPIGDAAFPDTGMAEDTPLGGCDNYHRARRAHPPEGELRPVQGGAQDAARQARALASDCPALVLVVSAGATDTSVTFAGDLGLLATPAFRHSSHSESADVTAVWTTVDVDSALSITVHGENPLQFEIPMRRGSAPGESIPGEGSWGESRPGESLPGASTPGGGTSGESMPLPPVVRGVLLDLDGVIYSDTEVLPGAEAFIENIRSAGIRLVAVTNYAGVRASDVVLKLERMGIQLAEHEVVTSGRATAEYVNAVAPNSRVLVLGEPALAEELTEKRLHVVEVSDSAPEYVVVGYCSEFPRARLEAATRCLLNGAKLVATNPDRLLPTPRGLIPECGPLIAFLEYAASIRARIVGKPNREIIDLALSRLGVHPSETVIIGDNLETDIEAGRRAGIATLWVRGPSPVHSAPKPPEGAEPTAQFRDLVELNQALFDNAPR